MHAGRITIGLILGAVISGCSLTSDRIEPSPLSPTELGRAVLDVVPVGTPREAALARLAAAGIEGGYGATGASSTYYCDLWRRPDGPVWHLTRTTVLFDETDHVSGVQAHGRRFGERAVAIEETHRSRAPGHRAPSHRDGRRGPLVETR